LTNAVVREGAENARACTRAYIRRPRRIGDIDGFEERREQSSPSSPSSFLGKRGSDGFFWPAAFIGRLIYGEPARNLLRRI